MIFIVCSNNLESELIVAVIQPVELVENITNSLKKKEMITITLFLNGRISYLSLALLFVTIFGKKMINLQKFSMFFIFVRKYRHDRTLKV